MYKKIYFGPKPLFLGSEITKEMSLVADDSGTVVMKDPDTGSLKKIIELVQQPQTKAAIFIHDDAEALFNAFKNEFEVIQAGGGLVYAEQEEEILLIFRRGKWDLPKGKLDPEEQIEACALREVEEETGLQNISIRQPLCTTYHTYHQDGQFILKESHWYLMTTAREQVLTPQTDEDIEQCRWVKIPGLPAYMDNSFPAIIDVVKEATEVLNKKAS